MRPFHTFVTLLALGTLAALPALVRADKAGDALLQKCVDAMTRATTFQADFTIKVASDDGKEQTLGSLKVKKPNLVHLTYSSGTPGSRRVLNSNGKMLVEYMPDDKEFLSKPVDMTGANIQNLPVQMFLNPDTMNRYVAQGKGVKLAGGITIGKTPCKTLNVVGLNPAYTCQFYIGPENILYGMRFASTVANDKGESVFHLTNVRVNVPIAANEFAWATPAGVKPYKPHLTNANVAPQMTTSLLAVGKAAPDFELPELNGGKVKLSTLLKANKATLLNFWSYF